MSDGYIETEIEIEGFLCYLKTELEKGAKVYIREKLETDEDGSCEYAFTRLFPNDSPMSVIRRELMKLRSSDYLRTRAGEYPVGGMKTTIRDFGKVYDRKLGTYVSVSVESRNSECEKVFLVSFSFARHLFTQDYFSYRMEAYA